MVRYNILTKVRSQLLDIRDSLSFATLTIMTHVPDRYDSRMANIDKRPSLRYIMSSKLNDLYQMIDGLLASINYWIATLENPITLVEFETLYRKFVSSEYEFYKELVEILEYKNKTDLELLWGHYKKIYGGSRLEDYENSRPYIMMRARILGLTGMKEYDAISDTIKSLKTLGDVLDPRYKLYED